jgi:D-alanine-D-alanine ligase
VPITPAKVDRSLADRIIAVARKAWQTIGGEGYGRVDMRVSADNQPYVLEVNPNPDLSNGAGYSCMARAEGWDYDTLVANVVKEAMDRAGGQDATHDLLRQVTA